MKKRRLCAFTLIEMLAVMLVMGILIALIVPAAVSIMRGSNLTQSGEMVSDLFVQARQAATASNRTVQMRFYQLPVPAAGNLKNSYCAVQLMRLEDNGAVTALTKLLPLRNGVLFVSDATHSTLITPANGSTPTVHGTDILPAYPSKDSSGTDQGCNYVGFQFLPNGTTDLDPTVAGGWFITLAESIMPIPAGSAPKNYYCLCVEPLTGHTRLLRS